MEEKIKGEQSFHAYTGVAWPIVVLCLVPILAHLPELVGWVHTYPLLFSSQLVLHPDSGVLPGMPFIDGNACGTTLCLGHLAAQDWLHGRLPWWNPYVGVGLPLASEMQPAAFFLPFILLLHFKSGVLLMKLVMQVLAGLACYAFLREIRLVRGAALLGSVLFQCNGTFALFGDAPVLPIAFLPLLALGVERARTQAYADRRGGEGFIALAIGFSLLAGFPETALLDGLLGFVWAMVRVRGLGRRAAIAFIWKVAAGGLIGLALAAPVLIVFLQDLSISTLERGGGPIASGLVPRHLATLLFPNIYGPPYANSDVFFWGEIGGYVGAATAFLAVLSLFQRIASAHPFSGIRWLLVVWILFWMAVSFGVPGVTGALSLVPGANDVWICRYCIPSVEFAFCVLAAFALDDDARSLGQLRLKWPLAVLGAACGLALMLSWDQVSGSWRQGGWGSWFLAISILWGVGTVLGLFLLLRRPDFHLRRHLIAGIVCANAIALFLPTTLAGLTNPAMFDAPIAYLRTNQGLQRVVSADYSLPPNVGALLGLGSLQYFYVPVPTIWGTFVRQRLDGSASFTSFPSYMESPRSVRGAIIGHRATLEALAVRYVVAPSSMDLYITLQDKAGEECFVPTISDRADCLYNLSFWANSFDRRPMRVFREGGVDIFELPGAAPYAETSGGPCQLAVMDREHMRATCDSPARLIRRELMYPGWTARVNGSATSIVTEGEIFQTIKVPAGVSDIEWRYAPLHASSIAAIFIAGVLALVALVVRSLRAARSI